MTTTGSALQIRWQGNAGPGKMSGMGDRSITDRAAGKNLESKRKGRAVPVKKGHVSNPETDNKT